MNTILLAENLSKNYYRGQSKLQVLKPTNLEINEGEFTFIVGPSGSGKSTLLQLLGGLDTPSSGFVKIKNNKINEMDDEILSRYRRQHLGYIFQFFNLLNNLNAIENVSLPLILDGQPSPKVKEKAQSILTEFGLKERLHHYPHELSGGQIQRVAVCRSLIASPYVVLADEPTGNLDSHAAIELIKLFQNLARIKNQTIVMVTHDLDLIKYGDRVLHIKDGEIIKDERIK